MSLTIWLGINCGGISCIEDNRIMGLKPKDKKNYRGYRAHDFILALFSG